jgi:hypothetical protein
MDPVMALSFAANIVALTETSIRILFLLKQVHERGSFEGNDAVKEWAETVSKDVELLQKGLSARRPTTLSPLEKRVLQLAQSIRDTSDELTRLLSKIAYHKDQAGKKESALKQVVRTWLKRGQIESLELKLKKARDDMNSGMLSHIYERFGKAEVLFSVAFTQLTQGQQSIIKEIITNRGKLVKKVQHSIKQSETKISQQIRDSDQQTEKVVSQAEHNLSAQLHQMQISDHASKRLSYLLNSLRFESINERQNYVQQRVGNYDTTFAWIFDRTKGHVFAEWLASEDTLFWISGKPGSGKSSLVNFILDQLQSGSAGWPAVREWAGAALVQVSSFFFYRPAPDALQKTLCGMWRSLCFQILNEDRDLALAVLDDEVAPESVRRHLERGIDSQLSWLTKDLQLLFQHLASKTTRRHFLLIDGLDECIDDHTLLLDEVKALGSCRSLKICCSSRPNNPFRAGFSNTPSLKVQDLTWEDIHGVVSRALLKTEAWFLVHEIARRAEGVFLWAKLVTNDVKRGLSDGENHDELSARVNDVSAARLGFAIHQCPKYADCFRRPVKWASCSRRCCSAQIQHI